MSTWTTLFPQASLQTKMASLFLDACTKSFILLIVVGAVCFCWRRAAASTRHLLWLLAMIGLVSLPVVSWLLPVWQKPLWTVNMRADSLNEITVTLQVTPGAGGATVDGSPPLLANSATPTASRPISQNRTFAMHLTTRSLNGLIMLWLSGTLFLLLRIAGAAVRLGRLRRMAHPPTDPDWLPFLKGLRQQLNVRRSVVLLQSPENVMPVTWGWRKPLILLPAEADGWSTERRRIVLLHELAHIKRWDCLTQMVAHLTCALYWFNPLVWIAARRMCVERERACDDLVLNGGCKASDYAAHLVEIARAFRRMPRIAAIAMARNSNLQGRIAAIVDGSRCRQPLPALLVVVCSALVLVFVAAVAAQKGPEDNAAPDSSQSPWFDARLRAFFAAKEAQARELGRGQVVAADVWPYFEAGKKGDWKTATNLWVEMRHRAHQYEGSRSDETLDKVWSPILETDLAWEQFANWKQKYVLDYGNDIIGSIPAGSIYFGGTDPGRGLITAMSESHAEAKPFFTITQNALADGTYLDYLRAMYSGRIYTPSADDSQKCFQEYSSDAQRRLRANKLRSGEDVTEKDGKVQVQGQIAVMAVNGLIAKLIFDRNPDREFYIEESFPLDWMYPHLTPNGLIMRINREPLTAIPDDIILQDQEYWSKYLQPMLGNWLNDETPVAQLSAFVRKVYVGRDLSGFTGDVEFIQDAWAQKAFSKLRSSIAGIYSWRMDHATNENEKQRMAKAADLAFRQAFALCPNSPEALFRYANLLVTMHRVDDARLLAQTSLNLQPQNAQVKSLLENLKSK